MSCRINQKLQEQSGKKIHQLFFAKKKRKYVRIHFALYGSDRRSFFVEYWNAVLDKMSSFHRSDITLTSAVTLANLCDVVQSIISFLNDQQHSKWRSFPFLMTINNRSVTIIFFRFDLQPLK